MSIICGLGEEVSDAPAERQVTLQQLRHLEASVLGAHAEVRPREHAVGSAIHLAYINKNVTIQCGLRMRTLIPVIRTQNEVHNKIHSPLYIAMVV